jgi:acyl carrier protein
MNDMWTAGEIDEGVRRVLAEQLAVPLEALTHDAHLVDSLGLDSFGMVELMFDLEDATGLKIPDEDVKGIRTVGELVAYVQRKLSVRG